MTHRAAWLIFNGEIPQGIRVLHHCDVPWCVNPEHLWLGTQKDNVDDMWKKQRANVVAAQKAKQKITEEQAKEIQRLYATGLYFQYELAPLFGCTKETIGMITRHIPFYSR
jgi:hypothetical protein